MSGAIPLLNRLIFIHNFECEQSLEWKSNFII